MYDVAVVGAGPAGASAALSAVRANPAARVLLLDRDDFPRDKACGDGIAPHVLDVLASIGVVGVESGYVGVDRLRIGFASGPTTNGVMARSAYVIPRAAFDARLVQAAVQQGVEFRHHRVRTAAPADGGRHVVLDGVIRASVVIAADGAGSILRRLLGPRPVRATTWPPNPPPSWWFTSKPPAWGRDAGAVSGRPWRFTSKPPSAAGEFEVAGAQTALAIRGYAPVPDHHAGQQVIVFADPTHGARSGWPAYAWSFPIGDGRANVGYGELLHADKPLSRRHLLDRLEALLPGASAGADSWRAHLLPLSTGRPRQPDGRILFAGDAMNLINPITGEGIFYAVRSGVLAGRAAVVTGLGVGDPGLGYRAALRRVLGVHLRHTDAATLLARSPAVVAAAVRAADRNQGTFDDLVDLGLGDGRLTPSTLRGIGAALLR